MAISKKSVTTGTDNGGSATVSVTTSESPTATAIGDLVVVVHGNDFYALTNMPTPTATGSPTLNAITDTGVPVDAGTNLAHIKGYWYVANTSGAQTVTVTETGSHDEEKSITAFVLGGADTTTAIDDAAGNFGTASAQVANGITAGPADDFLLIVVNSGGGSATASYTTPGPLTEEHEWHVGGYSGVAATAQLSASGATGNFTFTAANSIPYGAVTIAVLTATGGTPAVADPNPIYQPGFMSGRAGFPAFMPAPPSVGWDWAVAAYDVGASNLNGDGTLDATTAIAATGAVAASGAASIDETVSIAAAGGGGGAASLTVTAAITAAGSVTSGITGSATLTVTVAITAAGGAAASGGTTLALTATITAAGGAQASGTATLTGAAAITAAGAVTTGLSSGATLTTTATVTAAGTAAVIGASTQPVTITIAAVGTSLGNATRATTATVAATGGGSATPTRAVTVSITATGNVAISGAATLTVTAGLTASAVGPIAVPLTVTGTDRPASTVTGTDRATATVSGTDRPTATVSST